MGLNGIRALRSPRTWWRAKRRRLFELWAVGIVASVGVTGASALGYLDQTQIRSLDLLMHLRGPHDVSDVVIVAIDDAAFEAMGQRQPLPRGYLARVLRGVQRSGAAVVGLDIMLSAPTSLVDDTALTTAVREFSDEGLSRVVTVATGQPPAGPLRDLVLRGDVVAGVSDVPEDSDAVIRRANLLVRQGSQVQPTFALAILARLGGMNQRALETALRSPHRVLSLPLWKPGTGWQAAGELPRDVQPDTLWRVNFVGPARTFLTIPSETVATLGDKGSEVPADNPLRGRIVLVGATFAESRDFYATPHGRLAGIEIHANIVHMLATRSFIRPMGWVLSLGMQVLLVLVGGVLFTVVNPFVGTVICLTAAVVIGLPASYLIFERGHYWLDFMLPIFATRVMAWGVDLLDRRYVRETFGLYVGAQEAEKISRNDAKLRSERREVSIVYAGLPELASISEKMEPEEVTIYLRQFGTVMAEVIFRHGGMVDHLSGEIVMAVFGAPQAHSDHALRAVHAAMSMHDSLRALNERWAGAGLSALRMGVGVHTGHVVTGNVGDSGSPIRYAIVGVAVEVAARVQALAPELEAATLITETTRTAVGDRLTSRDRGALCLKSVGEDVRVYEVLDVKP